MKKLIILLALTLGTLMAGEPAFIYYIESGYKVTYNDGRDPDYFNMPDDLLYPTNRYSLEIMTMPSKDSSAGYVSPTIVNYATTANKHHATYYLYIYVYVPYNSNQYYFVDEINENDILAGRNETIIDDGFNSSYKTGEYTFSNGDKIVGYNIRDLSSATKRVKVITCPRGEKPTNSNDCVFSVVDILGYANSN